MKQIPELPQPSIINSSLGCRNPSLFSEADSRSTRPSVGRSCGRSSVQLKLTAESPCRCFYRTKLKKHLPGGAQSGRGLFFTSMVHFSVRKHMQPRRNNSSVLRPAHIQPSQLQNISALHQYCITHKNHSGIGNKVWRLLFLLQVLVGTLVINIHGRNIRAVIWLERCNRLAKI